MKNTYMIAGVVIDANKVRYYNQSTFIVCGMSVDWSVIEHGNQIFKGMSKAQGIFKDVRFCQRCNEIYNNERIKLINYNKNRGLNEFGELLIVNSGKDNGNMRHKDFKGYLTDAKEIYEQARAEYENIDSILETAKKEWENAQRSGLTDRDTMIARATYMQAEDAHKQSIKQLGENAKERLANVRKEMKKHIEDFYRADPSKLDINTLKLLESGVLSGAEMMHLANQNRDNVTMIRMIRKYAGEKLAEERKKGVHSDETVYLCHGIGSLSGEEELKTFDFLAERITGGLSTDKSWAKANNMLFNERFSDYLGTIDNMFARPEVSAE